MSGSGVWFDMESTASYAKLLIRQTMVHPKGPLPRNNFTV